MKVDFVAVCRKHGHAIVI